MPGLLEISQASRSIPLGSVGYERHKNVGQFAELLANSGVERLVDVRELPISRRRGFAKSALSGALALEGVEYVHMRSLGNPKAFRDLYKSGKPAQGEAAFRKLLLTERTDALRELAELVQEKRSALMCWEDDERICHRHVILQALQSELALRLEVIHI